MARISARVRASRASVRAAFRTEAALCDAFAAAARAEGYVVHAETSGWDLLLVCRRIAAQIGVQAKLRANCSVLSQALGSRYIFGELRSRYPGPDVHAVLVPVPHAVPGFCELARELRITVVDAGKLLAGCSLRELLANAPIWKHERPEWVPPVEIVGFGGGRSGPRQITPWKIAAVKLCILLRQRGWLVRADFARARVSIAWWVRGDDAVLRIEKHGRASRYVATGAPLPDERWPEVAVALLDEQDVVAEGETR